MFASRSPRVVALLQALFVTFLWATSWVLIKIGLQDIPSLTFAGLRYTLAAGCLLIVAMRSASHRRALRALTWRDGRSLVTLGIVQYAVTQGAQFAALGYLPAVTLSLIINFTVVVVVFMGIIVLKEHLVRGQWGGLALFLFGIIIYFYPINFPSAEIIGLAIACVSLFGNSIGAILGRAINRRAHISPLIVTLVSMGTGSVILLVVGVVAQGLPALTTANMAIIGWLAVVNTALAFTLWNHVQRTLTAAESSIINNTMLIQIALLAFIFLGEALTMMEFVGMTLAAIGIFIVQRWGRNQHVPDDRQATTKDV